jgi:hypothetical protein
MFRKIDTPKVEQILKNALRNKLRTYSPEPAAMPFHTRLLGKDRLALFSFIHSLNTNFGTSIFEPVTVASAKNDFKSAKSQVKVGEYISEYAQAEIQKIMNDLSAASTYPDKPKETNLIRQVCRKGKMNKIKATKVDVFLESKNGQLYLFDIKTAKPNAGEFKGFKRTLLEWKAILLAQNPKADINAAVAIPYNPYEPQPYNRWTIRGMLDIDYELKVAEGFWDFIGGKGCYEYLLKCFEKVGIELRPEIDKYFGNFTVKN